MTERDIVERLLAYHTGIPSVVFDAAGLINRQAEQIAALLRVKEAAATLETAIRRAAGSGLAYSIDHKLAAQNATGGLIDGLAAYAEWEKSNG